MFKVANSESEMRDVFQIRKEVFVNEQNVPIESEIDQYEEESTHIIFYEDNTPVAVGRFRNYKNNFAKVERVAVVKSHRQYGYGKKIMEFIEQEILKQGYDGAVLNGQSHAKVFYEKLGYNSEGDEFLEENIPHYFMKKHF